MGSADAPRRSLFDSHPAVTLVAINLALVLLVAAVAEVSLRLSGVKTLHVQAQALFGLLPPGFCASARRVPVQVIPSFITDGEGIFKANHAWPGFEEHINSDGFRGAEFQPAQDGRTSLLLLGDSFTWGVGATPLSRSFADRLTKAGYRVYNTGIPGADPEQYARIARKYVPRLRPQVTAVFVYMGNDITPAPLRVEPNRSLWYVTNLGFLLGYDETGRYFASSEEAIHHYRSLYCGDGGLTERFLFRTALGASLQSARRRGLEAIPNDWSRAWVRRALSGIRDVSAQHGSSFMLFLIPVRPSLRNDFNSVPVNLSLFDGFEPRFPRGFSEEDYGDEHFNNRGHRKYFEFIHRALASRGYAAPRGETD